METLATTLARAGIATVPLVFADGSRLLVLPSNGRLLGLYPREDDGNFLWTNPALESVAGTEALFAAADWVNPGGDRTWVAPELELFISDLTQPWETYAVPPALDPGNWELLPTGATEVGLGNATRLRLWQSGQEIDVRLTRHLRPAANPLVDTALAAAGLHYAGYAQTTTMALAPHADAALRLGIWNLLQLPSPGTMLIPTRSEAHPQMLFGATADDEITVEPQVVSWKMGGTGEPAKIGLKASPLTGRAGYLSQRAPSGTWDLVVREFDVNPAGDYVDALWNDPEDRGWVFQACCIRAREGSFNELEYHVPAPPAGSGERLSHDESRVWAFRGPGTAIAAAASLLLGTHLNHVEIM